MATNDPYRKEYYPSGMLKTEVRPTNQDGLVEVFNFHENGRLDSHFYHLHNKFHGEFLRYDDKGNLIHQKFYENGNLINTSLDELTIAKQELGNRIELIKRMEAEGELSKAAESAELTLDFARIQFGEESFEYLYILYIVGESYRRANQLQKSKDRLKKVIYLIEKNKPAYKFQIEPKSTKRKKTSKSF